MDGCSYTRWNKAIIISARRLCTYRGHLLRGTPVVPRRRRFLEDAYDTHFSRTSTEIMNCWRRWNSFVLIRIRCRLICLAQVRIYRPNREPGTSSPFDRHIMVNRLAWLKNRIEFSFEKGMRVLNFKRGIFENSVVEWGNKVSLRISYFEWLLIVRVYFITEEFWILNISKLYRIVYQIL